MRRRQMTVADLQSRIRAVVAEAMLAGLTADAIAAIVAAEAETIKPKGR